MKIKLLIATADIDYAEHLSGILSEKHADAFSVSVCSTAERLQALLAGGSFDAALLEQNLAAEVNLSAIHLPLLLADETGVIPDSNYKHILKYQRISAIAGSILENYAQISKGRSGFGAEKAHVTAVWSPSGGSGKTTVALAYAAHKTLTGKQAAYLNLENFSSTPVYFQEPPGKSISKVFGKLESNVHMFLLGIRQQDSNSGISYFCSPENYDDINIITADDIETLITACTAETDEIIIDLSNQCDERTRRIFSLADTVMLVCDATVTSQAKLKQFISQHNIFGQIREKSVLICNKGAKATDINVGKTLQLPLLQAAEPVSVFKSLSGSNFDW